MSSHNPYQSPLTVEPSLAPHAQYSNPDDMNWLTVYQGAKKCLIAMRLAIYPILALALLGTTAALISGLGQRSSSSGATGALIVVGLAVIPCLISMFAAWIFQLIGLIQLRTIPEVSGAKGLLTAALVMFCFYHFSHLFSSGLNGVLRSSNTPNPIMIVLPIVNAIVYVGYNVTLLLGMKRIGQSLGNQGIRNQSQMALTLSIVLFVLGVLMIPLSILLAMNGRSESWIALVGYAGLLGILYIGVLVVYSNALKGIIKHCRWIIENRQAVQFAQQAAPQMARQIDIPPQSGTTSPM